MRHGNTIGGRMAVTRVAAGWPQRARILPTLARHPSKIEDPMNSFKRTALAALLASSLLAAAPASALVWTEIGAGNSPATAEVTAGLGLPALTGINGFLTSANVVNSGPVYEIDLFKIHVADSANFYASVGEINDDTALFLFDMQGRAVFANDDFGGSLMPVLPAGSAFASGNGDYYLGIGLSGWQPVDSLGNALFDWNLDPAYGMPTGSATLAGWSLSNGLATPPFEQPIGYSITLDGATVAAVPEPASALMLLLGIGGLVAGRTLRRKQQAV